MDCPTYDFDRNAEKLPGNVDEHMSVLQQTENAVCNVGLSQDAGASLENLESTPSIVSSSSPEFTKKRGVGQHLILSSKQSEVIGTEENRKGRARLVRLQVASANSLESSGEKYVSGTLEQDRHSDISQTQVVREEIQDMTPPMPPRTKEMTAECIKLNRSSSSDEIPSSHVMQRYLTSDGQYVYGYKDSDGEYHFFYPTLNERETHNEKERKRRSRVSDACSSLRKLVPGLNDRTDKASVFEQASRYLKFMRNKFGTQYDQVDFRCKRANPTDKEWPFVMADSNLGKGEALIRLKYHSVSNGLLPGNYFRKPQLHYEKYFLESN